jgi:hypothetical protein
VGLLGNAGGKSFRGRAVVSYTVTDDSTASGELLSVDELAPGEATPFPLPNTPGTVWIELSLFDAGGQAIDNCTGEGLAESFVHGLCPCGR